MMLRPKYTYNTHGNMLRMLNISDNEKVFVRMEGGTVRYQYDNHLGSACLELDEYGYIISYEEYHPFGTTSYRAGRSATEVSLKRYKYCGKERDEETGLYYYGARYYASWLCRFVSVDPLQHEQPNKSPYHYCSNNPINRVDPTGMQDDEPDKKKPFSEHKFENFKFADSSEETLFKEYLTKISASRPVYEAIRDELIALEKSELEFMVRMNDNVSSGAGSGNFTYNAETKQLDINIVSSREFPAISILAHELKHAFQYLERKLALEYNKKKGIYVGTYYDKTDERDALERQQLFDPNLSDTNVKDMLNSSKYKKLPWADLRFPMDGSPERMEKSMDNFFRQKREEKPGHIYYNWDKEIKQWEGKLQ